MADVEAWENEGGWASQPKRGASPSLAQKLESARAALDAERATLDGLRDKEAARDAAFQQLTKERDRLKAEVDSLKRALRGIGGTVRAIKSLIDSFDLVP